jgi:hypothetical protein
MLRISRKKNQEKDYSTNFLKLNIITYDNVIELLRFNPNNHNALQSYV